MVKIKQDGKVLAVVEDDDAAFAWLLRHQSSSVSHALRHEGYSIESEGEVRERPGKLRRILYGERGE